MRTFSLRRRRRKCFKNVKPGTNFVTRVAQISRELLGHLEKSLYKQKTDVGIFGHLYENIGLLLIRTSGRTENLTDRKEVLA